MGVQVGDTLLHYRLTGKLGEGGMGVVYRATDTILGRDVALKVLPGEMAADSQRLKRFRREARTVALLNHPHIVTIFSIEEDAGTHFLTMELVEGDGLDEILAGGGPLPREKFFRVAVHLADAVAAAHARGIVHRDLKPANLKLNAEGRLKVLDFGLAKIASVPSAAEDKTQTLLTMAGGVMGTPAYMSPEQASGRPVDERSDVFSLGAVLYELATGIRPFDGDNVPAILYAVVHHEPGPVTGVAADLAGLDQVLTRCLTKGVAERSISAAQVRDELQSLSHRSDEATIRVPAAAKGTRPEEPSNASRPVIAVLPFGSTSTDPEIEEFAASLGSDVVDGVANTSQAVVLPGSATLRFRDQSISAEGVGKELGAGYVVQATVRRGGNRLRVTAQLVSVQTGTQIWSRQYQHDLEQIDLFDAGDDISAQIVSAVGDVHGVIFESERQRLEGRPVEELDPWECIFVTLGYDKFIDEEHHRLAGEALERAVDLDPGFPLAWGYLSWITTDEFLYEFNARPKPMERAMAAARRAVELDPYSHMLRWLLARVLFFKGDVDGFLSEGNKALELNSNDATVMGLIGFYSSLSGHWARGEELMSRAIALNPSYPSYYHIALGLDHFRQGRFEEALAEYRRITFTGNPFSEGIVVAILGHLGQSKEAASALRGFQEQFPDLTVKSIPIMYKRWNLDGELLDSVMKGLQNAGL